MNTEKNIVPLVDGLDYEWPDTPLAFRHIVAPKRLSKLVRNADHVHVRLFSMGGMDVVVQKGSLLFNLSKAPDTCLFVAVFNGIDLTVIGQLDTEVVSSE